MTHKAYTPEQVRAKIETLSGYVATGARCEHGKNHQQRKTVVVAFQCERTDANVYADVTYTEQTPKRVVDARIANAVDALGEQVRAQKLVLPKAGPAS